MACEQGDVPNLSLPNDSRNPTPTPAIAGASPSLNASHEDLPEELVDVKKIVRKVSSSLRSLRRNRASSVQRVSSPADNHSVTTSTADELSQASYDSRSDYSSVAPYEGAVGLYGVFDLEGGSQCLLHLADERLRWVPIDSKQGKKRKLNRCASLSVTFFQRAFSAHS